MARVHRMKRGDTLPEIVATLTDSTGAAVNLTGCEVKLFATRFLDGEEFSVSGEATLERDATILSPATAGRVKFKMVPDEDWDAGEEGFLSGSYDLEFEVTTGAGDVFTCPTKNDEDGDGARPYLELRIYEDLDS